MSDAKKAAVCPVCPRHCHLTDGQTGFCRARRNVGGKVVAVNYGRVTSVALDPTEKKPFARWESGKYILSVGSFGCNLTCPFCQNYSISQTDENCPTENLSPAQLVNIAVQLVPKGNVGAAFTYNEPLIGFEYVLDAAKLLKAAGLKVALVTNGTIETDLLRLLLPFVDAMNIDLKAWDEEFYRRIGGNFACVKDNIALAVKNCHVEVTTLVIPKANDDAAKMRDEAKWLASLSADLPLHISRFFPRYKMSDTPPTPVADVYNLAETAREYLHFVYTGNC